MSEAKIKTILAANVAVLLILAVAFGLLVPLSQARTSPREIVLVAKDMAFTVPYETTEVEANPTLILNRGERISILLRNEDPGMLHDFRIDALGLRIPKLAYGESGSVEFTVPNRTGVNTYSCSLHELMMTGQILIR